MIELSSSKFDAYDDETNHRETQQKRREDKRSEPVAVVVGKVSDLGELLVGFLDQ